MVLKFWQKSVDQGWSADVWKLGFIFGTVKLEIT